MSKISARGQYSSSDVRLVINKGTDSISKYIPRTVGDRFLTFRERSYKYRKMKKKKKQTRMRFVLLDWNYKYCFEHMVFNLKK